MDPIPLPEEPLGAELRLFEGPAPLVSRGSSLPALPGVYIVASGQCVSHIGTSGSLRGRVGSLASLGTHRGSAEVICAAHCSGESPRVWWRAMDRAAALTLERSLKAAYGEPPVPRSAFADCVNGMKLRDDLIGAAGVDSWEAGFVEAVFEIGEKLRLLFRPRFAPIWDTIGVPPGPWGHGLDRQQSA